MKEIVLAMNVQFKYEKIKSLVGYNRNKKRAAIKLEYSLHHINRYINPKGKKLLIMKVRTENRLMIYLME